MATLVGSVMTSHVPVIGNAIANHLEAEPYWKPFFDGYVPVHTWLAQARPDAVVVFHNDHGMNFFLDAMPTFAIGCAPEYHHGDEGWGIPTVEPHTGDPNLSWHVAESLIGDEFDITTCQEMLVDHAVTNAMSLLWPQGPKPAIVPIAVNTVMFPYPSAKRCYALGKSVGKAISTYRSDDDVRVLVLGSGGMSHQLDGTRAGFINKDFDLRFAESLTSDPAWLTQFSGEDLVEQTGSQGVELLQWLAARAAIEGAARQVTWNYHIPISNTAAGTLVLEPAA